jgi:hypothetical protein
MWMFNLDNETYCLTVISVTKWTDKKLLYEVQINDVNYNVAKSYAIDNLEQLDNCPPLSLPLKKAIMGATRKIESLYAKNQSVAFLNAEIPKLFSSRRTFTMKRDRMIKNYNCIL